LLDHDSWDHLIELMNEKKISSLEFIYDMSLSELEVLKKYIKKHLNKEFIVSSFSSIRISMLFAKKSSDDLRFFINYRRLNAITIKNRYSILLISQLLILLMRTKIFIKINIRQTYYRLRIREENEYLIVFECRNEQYEYRMMFFELINASTSFQNCINHVFKNYVNVFLIIYLDDILIFFNNSKEHIKHVRLVLKKLIKYKLYAKLEKCRFHLEEANYLSYLIESQKVRMKLQRIKTILKWSESKTLWQIQLFIHFVNFYKRFIQKFNRIIFHLTNLLKDDKKFVFSKTTRKAFNDLKRAFSTVLTLIHFDLMKKILLKTNASKFVLSEILFHLNLKTNWWHLVIFHFRKLTDATKNYITDESEMLVIINCCKKWRQYIENAQHSVRMFIDHCNQRKFLLNESLNRRKTRWWEKLSDLNLQIEYKSNKNNSADESSRRSNYENIDENKILNLNKLILRNDESSIHVKNELRKTDEQFAISTSMRKISQTLSKSKTIEMKNIKNDLFNNLSNTNIVQRVMIILTVRTRTLSSSKNLVSAVNENASKNRIELDTFTIRKRFKISNRTFSLVKKENKLFRKTICAIALKNVDVVVSSMTFRTILQMLQKTDQLVQKKRLHVIITSTTKKMRFANESKNDRRDNLWHIINDIFHYNEKHYIFAKLLRHELMK
jgi:hypothetical protein